jgi:hypothetical protein
MTGLLDKFRGFGKMYNMDFSVVDSSNVRSILSIKLKVPGMSAYDHTSLHVHMSSHCTKEEP